MKLRNKILLICFLLLMFTLFLNTSNVFASFNFKYNNIEYSVPDIPEEYKYFLIYQTDSGVIQLYACNNTILLKDYKVGTTQLTGFCSSVSGDTIYSYRKNGGIFEYKNETTGYSQVPSSYEIIYSNHDVYYGDELVFQSPVTDKAVIPALETAEEVPKAMVQTLRILIPVGLIVLGIGLVIYLIRRVISLAK